MSNARTSLSLLAVLVAAVPSAAIAAPQPATGAQPGQVSQPGRTPTQPGQTMQPGQTANQPAQATITDAEIVGVLESIADANIGHARMAEKSAVDRKVKRFAESMVRRSTNAKERLAKLYKKHKLQATGSQYNDTFNNEVVQDFTDLNGVAAEAFDRTYVDDQADVLTNIINTINNKLMPYAKLPALRKELETTLNHAQADLKEVQKLQQHLTKPTA